MNKIIVILFILILLSPYTILALGQPTHPYAGSMSPTPWSSIKEVYSGKCSAEVFSGLEYVGDNIVIGVGADHSTSPHKACFAFYRLGEYGPFFMQCLPLHSFEIYDIYSPWRNGSGLAVGWRDPDTMLEKGIYIFRLDGASTTITQVFRYDDPEVADERMNTVVASADTIIVSGKVKYGSEFLPATYVFKRNNSSWEMAGRIMGGESKAFSYVFRHDSGGLPAFYYANYSSGIIEIYRINTDNGVLTPIAEYNGTMPIVFRSTDVVGNDILGIVSVPARTVKLWSPEQGVFYEYGLGHNFTFVARTGSHYGGAYSMIYGFNVQSEWEGPVFLTNLVNYDEKIGKDNYRLKWNTHAPSILVQNYLVLSSAYGYADGELTILEVSGEASTTTTTSHETTTYSTTTTPPADTTTSSETPITQQTSSSSQTTTSSTQTSSVPPGHGAETNATSTTLSGGENLAVPAAIIGLLVVGTLAVVLLYNRVKG